MSRMRSNPIWTIHAHRRLIGLSYRRLATTGALSLITGLAQAALLLIVVRAATALTADTQLISGAVGPISASNLSIGQLIGLGFGVLGVLCVAEFATSLALASLTAGAQRTSTTRMLDHYSAASFEAQTATSRGDVRQVISQHSAQTAGLVGSLGAGLTAVVNFLTLAGSALILSPIAGLVVLVGLLGMLIVLRPLYARSRRLGGTRATDQRLLGSLLTERLELTREIRSFGVDEEADAPVRTQIDAVIRVTKRLRVLSRMTSVAYRLGTFAVVLAMLAFIDSSGATNLAALTGALLILLRSLAYGQAAQATYQSINEIVPVVDQLVEERDRLQATAQSGITADHAEVTTIGRITFDEVDFAYPGGEHVLKQVSFEIEQGDFVALVGPSGAGKSTIMSLLLRLREPTAGTVRVDNTPMSSIHPAVWRSRVAFVPQEPKLQSGTVSETIRFNRAEIDQRSIERAAERAHIADEIRSWPEGFDTQVGQLGEGVSGGQRQRLALARALAGNPDLLLLDEPTSALDPHSESLVAETLESLRGEMTVVVIAHRFHTVKRANRVIMMENGGVLPDNGQDDDALAAFMGQAATAD